MGMRGQGIAAGELGVRGMWVKGGKSRSRAAAQPRDSVTACHWVVSLEGQASRPSEMTALLVEYPPLHLNASLITHLFPFN